MKVQPDLDNQRGTILVVALWVLAILAVFAVALGEQASLEIKLAEYSRDRLKAEELARAAIERFILEKQDEAVGELDALGEGWSNNAAAFKDAELGEGSFTVSYSVDGEMLYGAEDETSKLNLNEADRPTLVRLFRSCALEDALEDDKVQDIAGAILAWRTPAKEEEYERYYLDQPYPCKNAKFENIAELLLVRYGWAEDEVITPELLYGIAKYLTVYGNGQVNLNTVPEQVLNALLGEEFPELAATITTFRRGTDAKIGTADDQWFAIGRDFVLLGTGEQKAVKNLASADTPDDPFNLPEWNRLKKLATEQPARLCVRSNIFTIHAQAEVRKAKKALTVTLEISGPGDIIYHFWHEI